MTNHILNELEEKIHYRFQNLEYLEMAMSHPSLKQSPGYKFNSERLEFLGDSVLNIVITKTLYKLYSNFDEGRLAQFRNYLVSKDIIVKAAKKIDLQLYIIMSQGEEKSGGRSNVNNIENSFEALIGAIYIDSDYSIEDTEKFVLKIWQEFFDSYDQSDDPKTYIQNYSQSMGFGTPKYNLIKQEGSPHSPIFTVSIALNNELSSIGSGQSLKEAQKNAARRLRDLIQENPTPNKD